MTVFGGASGRRAGVGRGTRSENARDDGSEGIILKTARDDGSEGHILKRPPGSGPFPESGDAGCYRKILQGLPGNSAFLTAPDSKPGKIPTQNRTKFRGRAFPVLHKGVSPSRRALHKGLVLLCISLGYMSEGSSALQLSKRKRVSGTSVCCFGSVLYCCGAGFKPNKVSMRAKDLAKGLRENKASVEWLSVSELSASSADAHRIAIFSEVLRDPPDPSISESDTDMLIHGTLLKPADKDQKPNAVLVKPTAYGSGIWHSPWPAAVKITFADSASANDFVVPRQWWSLVRGAFEWRRDLHMTNSNAMGISDTVLIDGERLDPYSMDGAFLDDADGAWWVNVGANMLVDMPSVLLGAKYFIFHKLSFVETARLALSKRSRMILETV